MKLKEKITNRYFFFMVLAVLLLSVLVIYKKNQAFASAPTYTLATTKTSAVNGETIPVSIRMDTGGNDVVVSRVVLRYNKNLMSVNTSDVDLTGSVFANGNTCVFPNDYSNVSLRNKPCQIISNNSTYGILSITLAMPSHLAASNPGTQINTANGLVATVNFHAIASVSSSLNAVGIYYVSNRNYYFDSDMIKDDSLGTDLLQSAPAQRSTVSNGDLNTDHKVDGADFSILHGNYSTTTPENVADIDGDGTVNGSDFSVLHSNFNKTY